MATALRLCTEPSLELQLTRRTAAEPAGTWKARTARLPLIQLNLGFSIATIRPRRGPNQSQENAAAAAILVDPPLLAVIIVDMIKK